MILAPKTMVKAKIYATREMADTQRSRGVRLMGSLLPDRWAGSLELGLVLHSRLVLKAIIPG